jgi:hypothetical protein
VKDIRAVVDYFNVSDMRFTAEFNIRSAKYPQEELHAVLAGRYFNPKRWGEGKHPAHQE